MRRGRSRRTNAGFTILEVMLASMLGLMVVLTAIGLFGSIRAASTRSEDVYQRRMELALSQEAVERAMRGFIMSGQQSPRQQPSTPGNSRAPNRSRTGDEGALPSDTPADLPGRPRVILELDPRYTDSMRWIGPDGRERAITPQRMEVTLSRPPVFAPPTLEELLEESLQARQDVVEMTQHRSRERRETRADRQAARDRASGRSRGSDSTSGARNASDSSSSRRSSGSRSGRSSDGSGSDGLSRGGANLEDLARRAGFDPGAVNRPTDAGAAASAAENVEQDAALEDEEVALAPGIRGVFELQWDPDDITRRRPGDQPSPDGGTWSLWWRLIETEEIDVLNEITNERTLTPREQLVLLRDRLGGNPQRRGMVQLASKLITCRWEAVRSGETLSNFTAYYQDELPAYITLEVETLSGQWMKWMFEVDWSRGEEPGTPIGGTGANAGSIPVLGDLPVIGNQFRNQGSGSGKGGSGVQTNDKGGSR